MYVKAGGTDGQPGFAPRRNRRHLRPSSRPSPRPQHHIGIIALPPLAHDGGVLGVRHAGIDPSRRATLNTDSPGERLRSVSPEAL
jgi:hypothetical protein